MQRLTILLGIVLAQMLGRAGPAYAIINGQPDDDLHPYVGLVTDFQFDCSGAAISPTIFITAAHCFDTPGQTVFVTFDPRGLSIEDPEFHEGHWFPDPEFCLGCGPGLPRFDTHDVAVVVFDEPVALPRYAQLPSVGLVDTLPNQTQVTSVGYGIQDQLRDIDPGEDFTRFFTTSRLIPSRDVLRDEFIKLSGNPGRGLGATCFGDSGGPNLLGDTDTILALTSFGPSINCLSVGYSYRIDTPAALDFINRFIVASSG